MNKTDYGEIVPQVTEQPLITFALLAYNQEKYIEDAVRGAFSQTYSPLEIVISDDASSDQTFAIISKMAHGYHGPHKLILNRNEQNQGFVPHLNKAVMELSHGEIIVAAAGDDESLPERVETLYMFWNDKGRKFCSMHSAGYWMTSDGKDLGLYCPPRDISDIVKFIDDDLVVTGATSAWHRSIFDIFGGIDRGVILEDAAIGFRGLLLGGVGYCDVPLVKYRQGVGITSKLRTPDEWGIMELSNQHRKDMKKVNYTNSDLELALMRRELKYEYRKALLETKMGRIKKSLRAIFSGVPFSLVLKDYFKYRHPSLYTTISKIKNTLLP